MTRNRHMIRTTITRPARLKAEEILASELRRLYHAAWAQLAREARRLNKAILPPDHWWGDWAAEFRSGIDKALTKAAAVLANAETRFFATLKKDVVPQVDSVVAHFKIRSDLFLLPGRLQERATAIITEWMNTANPVQDLLDTLSRKFSDRWAELTAKTQAGLLAAAATAAAMLIAGYGQWVFITMKDNKVCEYCLSRDGMIFDLNDPMPPEGTHDGCRCDHEPLVPDTTGAVELDW